MSPFVSAVCIALCLIQSNGVLTFRFDQDAADKAATRSVTSSEPGYWLNDHEEEVPVTSVDANAEASAEDLSYMEDGEKAIKDDPNYMDEDEKAVKGEDQKLKERSAGSLLNSGFNMLGNIKDTAANLIPNRAKETVANLYQSTEGVRTTARNGLLAAKERIWNRETQKKVEELRRGATEKGINAYKELNKNLSPSMAKYLNQGVAAAVKGVAAVQNSDIGKKISEKVSSVV